MARCSRQYAFVVLMSVLVVWWVQKAADAYSSCLEWISDNNLSIRRDVLEGMARCFIKVGHGNRALDIANILVIQQTWACSVS